MRNQQKGFMSIILVVVVVVVIMSITLFVYFTSGTNKLITDIKNGSETNMAKDLSQSDDINTIEKEFEETDPDTETFEKDLDKLDSDANSL